MANEKRTFKKQLDEQFARIGKALASPHRLELLELLMQCERTVESLAAETGMPVANASQHLQVLRAAHIVETHRQGKSIYYRIGVAPFLGLSRTLHASRTQEAGMPECSRKVRESLT